MKAAARDLADRAMEATVVLSFTRVGHEVRSRLGDFGDHLPGVGRVVLITGATSGLGLEAAVQLARAGAAVRFLARDATRAQSARTQIVDRSGNDDVDFGVADLADLAAVERFAEDVLRDHDHLDALIHNAGALLADRVVTTDGMEFTFQTQVVAPTLLTARLAPLLRKAPGRVVFVSSGGLYSERLAPERVEMSPDEYDGTTAYARAKRAQLALTHVMAERLASDGVTVNAMHPGWADTPGVRTSLPTFRRIMGPLLRTPAQGADTISWLALSPDAEGETGGFWLDRARRPEHKLARTRLDADEEARREQALWNLVAERAGLDAAALGAA